MLTSAHNACTIISAITVSDLRYIDYAIYLLMLRLMLNNLQNNSLTNLSLEIVRFNKKLLRKDDSAEALKY